MLLKHFVNILEELAPLQFAASWDNVGLLLGDPEQSISRAFLTIDYTDATAQEAYSMGADLVIAYHPPIFPHVSRLQGGDLCYEAARRNIALYSIHTALDVMEGGTNDVLADVVELETRRPLRPACSKAVSYKLVTFIPQEHRHTLSQALFEAGAGHIGHYTSCSFQSLGTGTFLGKPGTHPAVGTPGHFEQHEEIRIETIVPENKVCAVIEALKRRHPYEEPAFDLIPLASPPKRKGLGRIGTRHLTDGETLARKIGHGLKLDHLLIAGPKARLVERIAVCAGAGRDLLDDAIEQGADLFLTGELPHHDVLKAIRKGMLVICTLHTSSERKALSLFQEKIKLQTPNVILKVSSQDHEPLTIYPVKS
ncbi:Nif3-like dinuclear metal center hexameric protein [Pajaroellobacter abortibovis]|uniref:GTP cyclohydrolase 1 type 2 homolog n=1 Tax=Pajaroellobacter abortibovis TaxID=1882918 RepID=A0A1L6MZY5_9BACT|nr:Nif3-like dinuclear metal center hexameric protein [Pajaroellobacter abortibovis]APS00968.1 Nif3-like dinuclear metal center hexameric protein [Pajaroellobacter abortibovis]